MHAARALWATGCPYTLAFAAPSYLAEQAQEYAVAHGALVARQFATVDRSPNVILINEVKEVGDQGYEYLLRNEHRCRIDESSLSMLLQEVRTTDALIIAGGFDLRPVFDAIRAADLPLHVDLGGAGGDWLAIESQSQPLDSLTISTSSREFRDQFSKSPVAFWKRVLPKFAKRALLKENRGGSRLLALEKQKQLTPRRSWEIRNTP